MVDEVEHKVTREEYILIQFRTFGSIGVNDSELAQTLHLLTKTFYPSTFHIENSGLNYWTIYKGQP